MTTHGRRRVPPDEWRDRRHRDGLQGEQDAIAHLLADGWKLEAHRFKVGRHEIDLVVRRGRTVAFVEVKTRGSQEFGSGAEAVGWAKRRIIGRVAAVWRLRYGRPDDQYRFDLILVHRGATGGRVEHVPDAWRIDGWSPV